MATSFKFRRGDQVEDLLTGYKGVVMSRMDSITGCNRYHIQPSVDKDGKWVDGIWIDEHCLKLDPTKTRMVIDQMKGENPPG